MLPAPQRAYTLFSGHAFWQHLKLMGVGAAGTAFHPTKPERVWPVAEVYACGAGRRLTT